MSTNDEKCQTAENIDRQKDAYHYELIGKLII